MENKYRTVTEKYTVVKCACECIMHICKYGQTITETFPRNNGALCKGITAVNVSYVLPYTRYPFF